MQAEAWEAMAIARLDNGCNSWDGNDDSWDGTMIAGMEQWLCVDCGGGVAMMKIPPQNLVEMRPKSERFWVVN